MAPLASLTSDLEKLQQAIVLQDATREHEGALAAAEASSCELQLRLKRQLVSATHASAVAQRSSEEEAGQLRARLASSQGA